MVGDQPVASQLGIDSGILVKLASIDYDIANQRLKQLIADHFYLTMGYIRLRSGKKWGTWDRDKIIRYHARIIDTLRDMGYKMEPNTRESSVHELDMASKKYEKTTPAQVK